MLRCRPIGRFGADQRIRKRSAFREIQASATKVVTPNFVFLMRASEPERGARLGITASRRVGNAVHRNRAKRVVRESFRALRSSYPRGFDLVVIARRAIHQMSLSQVVAEWLAARKRMDKAFARMGLHPAATPTEPPLAAARRHGDSC